MLSTSIVIATRNRGSKIVATLESALANTVTDFELIVIDQSTNRETFEAVKPFTSDPRIIYKLIDIPGTCHARNMGIEETHGEVIIITDDDCILPENWIEKTLEPFEKYPQVGVTFCNVQPLPYDSTKGFTPHFEVTKNRFIRTTKEALSGMGQGLGLGAGMAVRREVMEAVGGFDESLGPGQKFPSAEDKDVAIRALLKGWQIYENADILVIHDGFRNLEDVRKLMKRDLYGAGGAFIKFVKCGVWEMLPMIIRWAVIIGIYGPISGFIHGYGLHGVKRLFHFSLGIIHGLRTPVDRQTYAYMPVVRKKPVISSMQSR